VFQNDLNPLSSDLSYDVCLEVRGEIIRTVLVLYCALKLCTVICTLRRAILSSLDLVLSHWAHFTVLKFIRVYLCVFYAFLFHTALCVVLLWSGPDGIEAQSLGPIFLQCSDTAGWVII